MAFIIKDRVKEGTTSTGTGAVTLGGASATFDPFNSYMVNGDTTYYAIVHTSSGVDEWEVGLGTWNTGNTLTRTTVLSGSNGSSAVDFSAGTKDVFMTYPAAHAALAGDDVSFANITVTGTVDGRDVATDGTKLDTIEQNADVTDAINVAAAGALMKSGGTMTGDLILNGDPTAALGAATKEYVDTIAAAGIHYHTPVRVEAPLNLTVTYDNGTNGVGATLTNAGTQEAITIDGVALSLNDRVLVYEQTDATQNGVYTVTTVGDGSTNWVLTRATDADTYGVSDPDAFGEGDAFFVKEGATGAGELYVMNTSGTITFGTTDITFTVIAETAVYSAGTGISLTGTTFSIGQAVGTTDNVTFNQVTAAIIGNVTGNLTGDVTGNADTASTLETARTIQLTGDVTGSTSFDGSGNVSITASVQDDSHAHVISNVDGLQTALDGKTTTARTITAGSGLTGGGDLTANRTISHADTSTQASLTALTGAAVVSDIDLDTYGHVTNLSTRNMTLADLGYTGETNATADQTITAGGGLSGGGTGNVTISHSDTSSQASVNNSSGTVIQDITLDTYGHITGINSVNLDGRYYTETEADSRFVNVSGDNMSGQLIIDTGEANPLELKRSSQVGIEFNDTSVGSRYLGVSGGILRFGINLNHVANDRVFHDGYHPNADGWTTTRTLSLSGDASGSVAINGSSDMTLSVTVADDSHNHTIANVDGLQTALNGKLSTSGKAADSNLLDGINSTQFLRSDVDDTLTGNLQINSHVINMDLNNIADNAIELREVRDSTWPFLFVTNDVGNDNQSGFWVNSNGYPDMRLRRENSTVRALISSWERSYVSNGFSISGGTLDMNNNDIVGVDQIIHEGDSNTYIQFHAADQWRVVTGGAERLEVNNSQVTSTEPIHAPSFHGDGSNLTGIEGVPTGVIVMWSGSTASIPSGWVICNGANGTPDLRDRFVVGAGSSYAVDATGGANTVTLSNSQIPSHTHSFSANTSNTGAHSHGLSGNTSNTGAHSHNGSTSNTGSHQHPINFGTGQNGYHPNFYYDNVRTYYSFSTSYPSFTNNSIGPSGSHSHNFSTSNTGNHSHTLSGNTTNTGNHSHSVSGTTGASGGSGSHENRPPYYALAYIMKT